MSFSIDVRLPEPVDIFVNRLIDETSRVARILLCQEEDFKFDLVFTIDNTPVSVISLYESIYGLRNIAIWMMVGIYYIHLMNIQNNMTREKCTIFR